MPESVEAESVPSDATAPDALAPYGVTPGTKATEVRILQAAFNLATRSLFTYFSEPGSVTSYTDEDHRLQRTFAVHAREDLDQADTIAALIRDHGVEPDPRVFPEKFTRFNYVTFTSLTEHLADDLTEQKKALEELLLVLPPAATPTVGRALQKFMEERTRHLAFWSAEAKRIADETAAREAARTEAARLAAATPKKKRAA